LSRRLNTNRHGPHDANAARIEINNTTTPYSKHIPVLQTIEPSSNDVHIYTVEISTLYTDNMSRFPIESTSGNIYIMLDTTLASTPFSLRHLKRNPILTESQPTTKSWSAFELEASQWN